MTARMQATVCINGLGAFFETESPAPPSGGLNQVKTSLSQRSLFEVYGFYQIDLHTTMWGNLCNNET